MNWRRFLLSAGLVILTNAFVLIGVAYNRASEPEAEITLTERELPLAYGAFQTDENTELALRLHWQHPAHRFSPWVMFQPRPELDWFDQAKLEAVGYDCSLPLSDPSAEQYYDKMLPREAFVVLAYGGQAWTRWLEAWDRDKVFMAEQVTKGKRAKQDLEQLNDAYDQLPKTGSRLLAVDVGSDPIQLRQRYPERNQFVIVRAQVRLSLAREGKTAFDERRPAHLRGEVMRILTDDIHVPFELQGVLDTLSRSEGRRYRMSSDTVRPGGGNEPRYEVTLRYGTRYEPWITAIRPLTISP
jgi:Domain of unknown function (DUF4824)